MSLSLIFGPMFSGKTTELIRRARTLTPFLPSPDLLLLIKHSHDLDRTKNASIIRSHDGETMPCVSVARLSDVPKEMVDRAQYIFVEEAQFFNDLKQVVLSWVEAPLESDCKFVTVAGLDGDSNRVPFGQIVDLIPYAFPITKLAAVCKRCMESRNFSSFFSSSPSFSSSSSSSSSLQNNNKKQLLPCVPPEAYFSHMKRYEEITSSFSREENDQNYDSERDDSQNNDSEEKDDYPIKKNKKQKKNLICIGGAEAFESLCRSCYVKANRTASHN